MYILCDRRLKGQQKGRARTKKDSRGRLSGEGLLSNLAPRSRDLALAHGFSRHPLSRDQAFFGLLRQEV